MEILRWTGCQRLAVINKQDDSVSGADWKSKLGSFFNLVRTFNAHKATYEERLNILKSLLQIDEGNSHKIQSTIDAIQSEWTGRQETAAEIILEHMQTCLMHEESVSVSRRDCDNEVRKEKEIETLKHQYFKSITKMQLQCFEKLMKLYKHHHIESKEAESIFAEINLEAEETWSKWGLSRNQLALAGGITGVTAGGAIDIGTAGATHGLGALFGGLLGATTTYLKGGALPNFSISLEDMMSPGNSTHDNEQRKLKVESPDSENYPWILLDAILFQYHAMLERSHGRRDKQTIKVAVPEDSYVRKMTSAQRNQLTKWFISCKKRKPDYSLEPKVLEVIEEALQASTS